MITTYSEENKKTTDSKNSAFLEQLYFMRISLDRLEKKLDLVSDTIDRSNEKVDRKIEKLENKIDERIKWIFNNLLIVFFSSSGLILTIYQIWKKM